MATRVLLTILFLLACAFASEDGERAKKKRDTSLLAGLSENHGKILDILGLSSSNFGGRIKSRDQASPGQSSNENQDFSGYIHQARNVGRKLGNLFDQAVCGIGNFFGYQVACT